MGISRQRFPHTGGRPGLATQLRAAASQNHHIALRAIRSEQDLLSIPPDQCPDSLARIDGSRKARAEPYESGQIGNLKRANQGSCGHSVGRQAVQYGPVEPCLRRDDWDVPVIMFFMNST